MIIINNAYSYIVDTSHKNTEQLNVSSTLSLTHSVNSCYVQNITAYALKGFNINFDLIEFVLFVYSLNGVVAQEHRRVTVKRCLWVGFHSEEWIIISVYFHLIALAKSAPWQFGKEWGTKCLNTRSSLPTLIYAGYRADICETRLKKKIA